MISKENKMEKYIGKNVLVSNTNVQYTKRLLIGILEENKPYVYICRDSFEGKHGLIGWKYCKPIIEYPKYWITPKGTIIKQTSTYDGVVIYSSNGSSGNVSSSNFEMYKEIPFDKERNLWHGQPVIVWNNSWSHIRNIGFYNAVNKRVFNYDGGIFVPSYDNIKPLNTSNYEDWMLETIKGIHNDLFKKES